MAKVDHSDVTLPVCFCNGCTECGQKSSRSCGNWWEKCEIVQLFQLLDYAGIFASKGDRLGRTNRVKHVINIDNCPPIRQSYRCTPVSRGKEAH